MFTYISVSQAQSIFKQRFEFKIKGENEFNIRSKVIFNKIQLFLTQQEVKATRWLAGLVGHSKKGQVGVWCVEIDEFYLAILSEDHRLIYHSSTKTVDDVFKFSDRNNDGVMDFTEFKYIINTYISSSNMSQDQLQKYSSEKIEELFYEFAQPNDKSQVLLNSSRVNEESDPSKDKSKSVLRKVDIRAQSNSR